MTISFRRRSNFRPTGQLDLWVKTIIEMSICRQLLRSTMRLTAKVSPRASAGVDRVVLKLCSYNNAMVGRMKDLFPGFKFVCNLRRPLPSARSLTKVTELHKVHGGWAYGALGFFWRSHMGVVPVPEDFAEVRKILDSKLQVNI